MLSWWTSVYKKIPKLDEQIFKGEFDYQVNKDESKANPRPRTARQLHRSNKTKTARQVQSPHQRFMGEGVNRIKLDMTPFQLYN